MLTKLFSTYKNVGPFNVVAYVNYDSFPSPCPFEDGFGNIVLFKEGNPEQIYSTHKNNPWAFPISCYKHGNTSFFLQNEGVNCRFDTAAFCGYYFLYPETIDLIEAKNLSLDAKTQLAKEYAREELKQYSDWVNGEVYEVCVSINEQEEELYSSGICGLEAVEKELDYAMKMAVARLEKVLACRYERLLKLTIPLLLDNPQFPKMPQRYAAFYKPVHADPTDVFVNYLISDSLESIIKTMNEEKNLLLHLFDLDKDTAETSSVGFGLGYVLTQ